MNDDALRYRMEMRLSFGNPPPRMKPKADHHERMAAYWLDMAWGCSRPPYHEARRFTRDRWQLRGHKTEPWQHSSAGSEKPYGWFSRAFWKYVWLAMRESFLAEWHREQGTLMPDYSNSRQHAVITNLTS